MDKKEVAWLYRQLPELVAKGVISSESADQVKQYYGPIEENNGGKTFLMVFGIIGVVLVGLGIILILAHNWAALSRPSRLGLSVGLLVVSQAVAGYTLWFKQERPVWREAAAALQILMLGAAMSLVGQTYHLTEDTDAFLLTWVLLSLPLIYLMKATSAAVLCGVGITLWAVSGYYDVSKQLVWVLWGMALPYYWQVLKQKPDSNAAAILSWVFAIAFYICFAAVFSKHIDSLWMLIYSALFSITYSAGVLGFNPSGKDIRMPFKVIGLTGTVGLTFMLTFKGFWNHLGGLVTNLSAVEGGMAIVLLLAVICGILLTHKNHKSALRFVSAPIFVALAYILQIYDNSGAGAAILVNGYILWLGLSIITTGAKQNSIGVVNVGMLLVTALIVARFLDINFSFITRGVVFVLLGATFLAANLIMVRRKARWDNNEK